MQHRLFAAFCLLFATGLAVAQAYRWVDENGIVHYSDRPREGAEEIILPRDTRPSRPRVPAPRTAPANDETADGAPEEPASGYERLEIASPSAEETLWNIEGTLNVTLNLQPALREGHRVRVYFDGEPQLVSGTTFQIDEVYRGVHNIQAEILDATGTMLIRSMTNRFYVQQTSVARSNPGATGPR